MSELRVHILHAPQPREMARLRRRLGARVELDAGPRLAEPASFQVLVGGRFSAAELEASPALEAVIVPFAGVPEDTLRLLAGYPRLTLHNLHHNAAATAEGALALLLAAAKRLLPADRALRAGDWRARYRDREGLVLAGRTALVVGLGAVGVRVARALRALGLRVVGVRRDGARACAEAEEVVGAERLDELLPRAEVLVLCCPCTAETQGLLDARRLALLPAGAILVNVGRGGLVAEEPLYRALRAGRLGAAGLDVWWRYPEAEDDRELTLPSALPFHELENVVMSPHRAGHGEGVEPARMDALAELLERRLAGEPLPNRVDLARGY
ncbi:MAG: NAD(P)-dependent oxidoreductase [Planctomycetota bacterium]